MGFDEPHAYWSDNYWRFSWEYNNEDYQTEVFSTNKRHNSTIDAMLENWASEIEKGLHKGDRISDWAYGDVKKIYCNPIENDEYYVDAEISWLDERGWNSRRIYTSYQSEDIDKETIRLLEKINIFCEGKEIEMLGKRCKENAIKYEQFAPKREGREEIFQKELSIRLQEIGYTVTLELKVKYGRIDIFAENELRQIIIETKASSELGNIQRGIGQLLLYKHCIPEAELYFASPYEVKPEFVNIMNSLGINNYTDIFNLINIKTA